MSSEDHLKAVRKYRRKYPWRSKLIDIRSRCTNPNSLSYKHYGAKGITTNLTFEQIEKVWFRDKASSMKRPSIDRINTYGNYTLSNIRFIELKENLSRQKCYYGTKRTKYRGVCFDKARSKWMAFMKNGKFINIGRFGSPLKAAKAYNDIAKQVYGKEAILNEV